MAKMCNSFTLMVVLAVASRVVLATEIIEESISPEAPFEEEATGPTYYEEIPPEPSPEEKKYIQGCVKKITDECAEVIFDNIFTDGKNVISDDCCRKLVAMGRQCHDSLVKRITEITEFKGTASITVPKSVEVFDKCVEVAGDISPTPTSS